MRIDVSQLRRQVGHSEQHNFSAPIALTSGPPTRMETGVRLTNVGPALLGEFVVEFELEESCSRCLGEISVPIRLEFQREYRAAKLDDDCYEVSFYEGDVVDVEPDVREQALLAIPMQPLCRDDCPGLCAACGQDLNLGSCSCEEPMDPRLESLTRLLAPEKDGGQ